MCCFYLVHGTLGLLWSASVLLHPGEALGSILFGPPPLIPTTHLCLLSKFARNPSGARRDEQIMLATPRGKRSLELWVTTVIWKTRWRRVVTARWASEMHINAAARCWFQDWHARSSRCRDTIGSSSPVDNVADNNSYIHLRLVISDNSLFLCKDVAECMWVFLSSTKELKTEARLFWSFFDDLTSK